MSSYKTVQEAENYKIKQADTPARALASAARIVKNVINEIEEEEHYKEIIKNLSLFEIIKYKYFK